MKKASKKKNIFGQSLGSFIKNNPDEGIDILQKVINANQDPAISSRIMIDSLEMFGNIGQLHLKNIHANNFYDLKEYVLNNIEKILKNTPNLKWHILNIAEVYSFFLEGDAYISNYGIFQLIYKILTLETESSVKQEVITELCSELKEDITLLEQSVKNYPELLDQIFTHNLIADSTINLPICLKYIMLGRRLGTENAKKMNLPYIMPYNIYDTFYYKDRPLTQPLTISYYSDRT